MRAGLRIGVGIAIGGLLFYLVFRKLDWNELRETLQQANYGWLALGSFILIFSHVARAYRWRQLLQAAGEEVPLGIAFAAVMTGYLVNYGVPRLGEAVRCTMIYRTHRVPITTSAGTVITDRATDVFSLALLLLTLFLLEAPLVGRLLSERGIGSPGILAMGLSLLLILGVLAAWGFWRFRKKLVALPYLGKLFQWLLDTLQAVLSVRKLRSPIEFVVVSVLIWTGYWLSGDCLLRGAQLHHGMYFSFVLTLLGAVGMALPSPGGLGSFHAAFLLGYISYGFPQNEGLLAGLVVHTTQLIVTVVVGLACYGYLVGRRTPSKLPVH